MDTQKLKIKLLTRDINNKPSSFDPRDYKDRYYFNKNNKATGKIRRRRRRKTGKVKKKTQKYLDLDKYFLYLPRSKKNTRNKFRKNSRKIKINKAAGRDELRERQELSENAARGIMEGLQQGHDEEEIAKALASEIRLKHYASGSQRPGLISPRLTVTRYSPRLSHHNNSNIMDTKILVTPHRRKLIHLWPPRATRKPPQVSIHI